MVLALNVGVYFCKLLPLHMNGNLPVGIGMHVFAMICDLIGSARSVPERGRATPRASGCWARYLVLSAMCLDRRRPSRRPSRTLLTRGAR
eukprot:UN2802